MIATLNYMLEANLVLLLMLAFYAAFLRRETNFRLMRMYLLFSILASVLFPLMDIQLVDNVAPLSIGRVIPTYWLPEVTVGGHSSDGVRPDLNLWKLSTILYWIGFSICLLLLGRQLLQLFRIIRRANTYRVESLRVAESAEDKPTFSFFRFVFIGKANELTEEEKQQIILHESVHARQYHSFDIIVVHVLRIFFWFNPFISTYKKIFIQLHEFEADARAAESTDVNKYCSLLARVALASADIRMANHFNNSLTVKRIEMMRTIKTNIKRWKLAALVVSVPMVFFFISCQDQVIDDLTDITKNSSHALVVPLQIQERFERLKKENPQKNYALLELNETATRKLKEMEAQYGLPKHVEVFNTSDTHDSSTDATGLAFLSTTPESAFSEISLSKKESGFEGQTFAIVEFTDQAREISHAAAQDDQVFTVVEHQPEFPGGYEAMGEFIKNNMRYPKEARRQGIEGTVYISFIVEKDGSTTSPKIVKGISPDCDAEVQRVLSLFPKWAPGKQGGQIVRVRFVMPVKFAL